MLHRLLLHYKLTIYLPDLVHVESKLNKPYKISLSAFQFLRMRQKGCGKSKGLIVRFKSP